MSWWGWLLLGFGVVLMGGLVLLIVAVRSVARLARDVAASLDDLRRQTLPLLADTRAALRKEQGANRKVDALLNTAESLSGTVDSASRLAHRILTSPFVKLIAFFTGTRRVAQRLREATDPASVGNRWTRARRQTQRQSLPPSRRGPGKR